MIVNTLLKEYELITKELFDKGFLSIGLGSISMKLKEDLMLINKHNKHYLEEDFIKKVHILREDISWKEINPDIKLHSEIYKHHSNAKAIAHIFPINTMTLSQTQHFINPLDFIGKTTLNRVKIIEIPSKTEWNENKSFIISKNLFQRDIIIIRGFGVFICARDLRELLKKAIILENSSYIILNSK